MMDECEKKLEPLCPPKPCCDPCPALAAGEEKKEPPPEIAGTCPEKKEESKKGEPCYFPQPEDLKPTTSEEMGPIGPWATGRLDWGPLAGFTGTRPVVDKYSISRYSEGEWRQHNKEVLENAATQVHDMTLAEWNIRQCVGQLSGDVDIIQESNTNRLKGRQQELNRWKCELEKEIEAMSEEITLIAELRDRFKWATKVLMLPESIAGDAIERRTSRLDTELVRDPIEEELVKELALIAELREMYGRVLKEVECQLVEDRDAKARMELDWSDKKQSLDIEAYCIALTNSTNSLMFHPGAVILPEKQSSIEYWSHFTRETLEQSRATRQRSAGLRNNSDGILQKGAKDLRTVADKIDLALAKRVACTEEMLRKLEYDLRNVLQKLVDVEKLLDDIREAVSKFDQPMKKAQTRLHERLERPRVENCRDPPCFGLIEEVKSLKEKIAAVSAQRFQAEAAQQGLTKARGQLEKEIFLKKKTLEIDRDRIQWLRSFYPSVNSLAGG